MSYTSAPPHKGSPSVHFWTRWARRIRILSGTHVLQYAISSAFPQDELLPAALHQLSTKGSLESDSLGYRRLETRCRIAQTVFSGSQILELKIPAMALRGRRYQVFRFQA